MSGDVIRWLFTVNGVVKIPVLIFITLQTSPTGIHLRRLYAVLGFGTLVGERNTTKNHENKRVESCATGRGAFTGVIFF